MTVYGISVMCWGDKIKQYVVVFGLDTLVDNVIKVDHYASRTNSTIECQIIKEGRFINFWILATNLSYFKSI